ncbi:MAG: GGDEF domain-containing protein [Pseudomonadota bacterium]
MQTQILGLLTPLMALFFALTFAVFWRAGRLKRHVLGFALGYLFFACGFLVTHLLPGDAFYVFHTTQGLYTLGVTFFLASACERVGQKLHLPSLAVIYAISALVLAVAMQMSSDAGPRLILINMGYGAMFVVGVTTLMAAPRRDWIDNAVIAITALQAVDFFIRPTLSVLYEQTIPAETYQQSVYYSLIGLVLGLKSIAGGLILIGATIVEWTGSVRESGERDPLTGLPIRGAYEQKMRSLLPRAQVEGVPICLVIADIDHFKQVNDIWGHQAGDQAISAFGELIADTIRACDMAGRIGGEEFCIAVWNCEEEPAGRLAERIRHAFATLEHAHLNRELRLTASFGVAKARAGDSYERLFQRADAALYKAKSAGRNGVVVFDDTASDQANDAARQNAGVTPDPDAATPAASIPPLGQRNSHRP